MIVQEIMSIDLKAMALPKEKMDMVWVRIVAAGPDGAAEAFTSTLAELAVGDRCEADVYQLDDIIEAWEEGDEESLKVRIADFDLALAWSLATVQYGPESGRYAWNVLEALIKASQVQDRDRITTAEWIDMFRGMTEERLAAMRERIEWSGEVDEVLKGVRGIAKYCHEHGVEMAVCSMGDAILQYPFSDRADAIYQKLAEAWNE